MVSIDDFFCYETVLVSTIGTALIIFALIIYVKLYHGTSYYNDETYLLWISYDNMNELYVNTLSIFIYISNFGCLKSNLINFNQIYRKSNNIYNTQFVSLCLCWVVYLLL